MRYFYKSSDMEKYAFAPSMTSSAGFKISGEHMVIGIADKPQGTGSQMHKHNVEQFNYVLKGKLRAIVNGQEEVVGPGGIIHIPRETLHTITAEPGEDVVFLVVKDKFKEYKTTAEDDGKGPRFEKGFGPGDEKVAGVKY
jgi:quercetin dioxygenase-like cupin family protein